MRYYEDIEVGESREYGEYHVTKAEIIEFAERYDPQPFHTDEEAAKESAFGELVASGWHTASMCMRMVADGMAQEYATVAGLGVDELRWRKPVKPGDTLSLEIEIVDKHPSDSNPDRGFMRTRREAVNQDDEVVISFVGFTLIERRKPDE